VIVKGQCTLGAGFGQHLCVLLACRGF
jgi:hypothetical protein